MANISTGVSTAQMMPRELPPEGGSTALTVNCHQRSRFRAMPEKGEAVAGALINGPRNTAQTRGWSQPELALGWFAHSGRVQVLARTPYVTALPPKSPHKE